MTGHVITSRTVFIRAHLLYMYGSINNTDYENYLYERLIRMAQMTQCFRVNNWLFT